MSEGKTLAVVEGASTVRIVIQESLEGSER